MAAGSAVAAMSLQEAAPTPPARTKSNCTGRWRFSSCFSKGWRCWSLPYFLTGMPEELNHLAGEYPLTSSATPKSASGPEMQKSKLLPKSLVGSGKHIFFYFKFYFLFLTQDLFFKCIGVLPTYMSMWGCQIPWNRIYRQLWTAM